jgi:hypothetical protein
MINDKFMTQKGFKIEEPKLKWNGIAISLHQIGFISN